jgi:SAM-dependent methyltransferase
VIDETATAVLPPEIEDYPDHDPPDAPLGCRQVVASDVIYRLISSGEPCWISDASGARRPLPIDRWIGGAGSSTQDRRADQAILDLCTGSTMDIGCGPGRFTAALADLGRHALGVDVSATAVEMTVERGGTALHQDVFAPLPCTGEWSHVLLADGNIGIGGDPCRLLRRASQLLDPQGVVVAEIDTRATGVTREYRRWETDHSVGRWFPWAHVGSDALAALAESAGFILTDAVDFGERFVAVLQVV